MFQKGNKYGRGNSNSGTKTKKEIIEAATETITQEALINLANSRVYKQMIKESGIDEYDYLKTKELSLPITLKGMIERKDLTSGGKPIPLLQGIVKENDSNNSSPKAITTEETT